MLSMLAMLAVSLLRLGLRLSVVEEGLDVAQDWQVGWPSAHSHTPHTSGHLHNSLQVLKQLIQTISSIPQISAKKS